jgi:hypothetical protein
MEFKSIDALAASRYIEKLFSLADGLVDRVPESWFDWHNRFDIGDSLADGPQMHNCLQVLRSDPASAQLLEERYLNPECNLETWLHDSRGSLGWAHVKLLSALNCDPDFYRNAVIFVHPSELPSVTVPGAPALAHASRRMSIAIAGDLGPRLDNVLDDFRSFYFDTALSASPAALPSLLAFAKPDHVLFGSDWPLAPEAAVG